MPSMLWRLWWPGCRMVSVSGDRGVHACLGLAWRFWPEGRQPPGAPGQPCGLRNFKGWLKTKAGEAVATQPGAQRMTTTYCPEP